MNLTLQSKNKGTVIEYSVMLNGAVIKTKSVNKTRTKSINQGGRGRRGLLYHQTKSRPIIAASIWTLPRLGTNVYDVTWHRVAPKKPGKDEFVVGTLIRQWVGVAK